MDFYSSLELDSQPELLNVPSQTRPRFELNDPTPEVSSATRSCRVAYFESPKFGTRSPEAEKQWDIGPRSHALDTRKGPSKEQWEAMRPIIRRLYLDTPMALDEVSIVMILVYGFIATENMYLKKFAKWVEMGKNTTQARPNARKPSVLPESKPRRSRKQKKTKDTPLFDSLLKRLCANAASTARPKTPGTCRQQEIVLHTVHNCAFGFFESHGWTFDRFSIFPLSGAPTLADTWQQLADEAFGASVLFEKAQFAEAGATVRNVFVLLETALSSPDPAMLVKFWGVARRFADIGDRLGDDRLLLDFLRHCRSWLFKTQQNHPLLPLLVSLTCIEPEALHETLRIGYLKSIHSLKDFVRGGNAIVLAMWSNYIKYWDAGRTTEAALAESYSSLIEEADRSTGDRQSATSISVLHRALYAAYYNLNDTAMTISWASDLLQRTMETLGRQNHWKWGLETQAFAFASKLLALTREGLGDTEAATELYGQAITLLQQGDRECCTRALMLSGDLAQILARRGDTEEAMRYQEEQIRISRLLVEMH